MSQPLPLGTAVQVSRPGRTMHAWQGRILEASASPDFVWVAFQLKGKEATPPDERDIRNKAKCQYKLMPTSSLSLI